MATAICTWHEYHFSLKEDSGKFIQYSDPVECRASIGEKIVTVWLPQGAKLRFRRSLINPDNLNFRHYFGRYETGRKRIDICVKGAE